MPKAALEVFHRDFWRRASQDALERKCREQELRCRSLQAEAETLRSMNRALEQRVARGELEAKALEGRRRERCSFGTCVICLQDPVTHVVVPCGHLALCVECSTLSLKKCPMCNHRVERVIKVFTPGLQEP